MRKVSHALRGTIDRPPCTAAAVTFRLEDLLLILDRAMALQGRARSFGESTRLLGALPELDSMAVVNVLEGIETHYGLVLDDGAVQGDVFETVGTLARFVQDTLAASGS